jgi:hypothetical protein
MNAKDANRRLSVATGRVRAVETAVVFPGALMPPDFKMDAARQPKNRALPFVPMNGINDNSVAQSNWLGHSERVWIR